MYIDDLNYDRCCLRKERDEARNELKATKHSLWMARAKICELERLTTLRREWEWTEGALDALEKAKRKCIEKAKEFK